jgi:hypothetical protein
MKRLFKPVLFAAVGIILFSACQGSGQKTKKAQEPKIKKEEIKEEVKKVVYPLPTSFEVTEMLNRIEASYIYTLSNPPEKADSYITEKEKALALGAYGADLSYASTYNQKQRVLEYMNVSKKLLEELDISAAVDPKIIEELENAGNDKDKLVEIVTNSFYSTYSYLISNGRAPVAFLIMSGSWVEALYIATHISEETFENKEMVTIIMKEKEHLDKLMGFLEKYKSSDDVASVIEILTPLYETYNSMDATSITKQQMLEIAKEVDVARKQILK